MCINDDAPVFDLEATRREHDAHLRAHSGQHRDCGDCATYRNRVTVLREEYGYSLPEAARLACTLEGLEIVAGW
jgi:hypothetical protein